MPRTPGEFVGWVGLGESRRRAPALGVWDWGLVVERGQTFQLILRPYTNKPTHTKPHSFFDYIVVGSGPGGATVARYLSDDPKIKVGGRRGWAGVGRGASCNKEADGLVIDRLSSSNPLNPRQVLLLEAGENHDNDEVISDSADAWIGGCESGLGLKVMVMWWLWERLLDGCGRTTECAFGRITYASPLGLPA